VKISRKLFHKIIFAYVFILIIVIFEIFFISQGSVATLWRCGEIFNNHVI